MNTPRIQDSDPPSSRSERFVRGPGRWGAMVARIGSMALGVALCVAAQAQRAAAGTATVINGMIAAVTVTDPGEGYVNPPGVTFSGGGGVGAKATASLNGSGVGSITVTATGSGYWTELDVVIGPPGILSLSILDLKLVPEITIHGGIGTTNQIQWVSALKVTNAWDVLTNIALPSRPYVFYDTLSPRGSQQFYRAIVNGGGARLPPPVGFVWLPPGRFTMGSPSTEQGRGSDEGPQTVETLSRGIYMGAHEVTQAEYQAVVGEYPSHFTGDIERPVEQVNWSDAVNYCIRLTEQERTAGRLPAGWVYRLPTEAEWEYAARAGRTNRFSFGDDPGYRLLGDYAWHGSNSGNTTHAVAGKSPNRWGLYDMNGNVWEWCSDWYSGYPGGIVTDPRGATGGSYRVVRGGGWFNSSQLCRSAQRNNSAPGSRINFVGFRTVLAPDR